LQQTKLIQDLVDVLLSAQAIETNHLDISKSRLLAAETAFQAVNPATDQEIFIDFNIRPFTIPMDWKFEPCQNFYDIVGGFIIWY
jgi:formin-binding protein 1